MTPVWFVLMLATGISWWLATGAYSSAPGSSRRLATACLLAIALIKVRLIVRHFMEVDRAPRALRFATDAWIVAAGDGAPDAVSPTWLRPDWLRP